MTRRHLFTALFSGGAAAQMGTPPDAAPLPYPFGSPLFHSAPESTAYQPDGTWRLSRLPAGPVVVVLNGLVMQPGVDYNLDGQTITFTPGVQDTFPDDWVGAVYQ